MALPSNFFSSQSALVVDDLDTIRSAVKGMVQMLGTQKNCSSKQWQPSN
ncbi:hypothetical protein ACLKMH_21235 [Psychromonas sp. KJ10-10]